MWWWLEVPIWQYQELLYLSLYLYTPHFNRHYLFPIQNHTRPNKHKPSPFLKPTQLNLPQKPYPVTTMTLTPIQAPNLPSQDRDLKSPSRFRNRSLSSQAIHQPQSLYILQLFTDPTWYMMVSEIWDYNILSMAIRTESSSTLLTDLQGPDLLARNSNKREIHDMFYWAKRKKQLLLESEVEQRVRQRVAVELELTNPYLGFYYRNKGTVLGSDVLAKFIWGYTENAFAEAGYREIFHLTSGADADRLYMMTNALPVCFVPLSKSSLQEIGKYWLNRPCGSYSRLICWSLATHPP